MLRHLLKRFLLTLPALWLVLTLVFLMIHIVPGDPVDTTCGNSDAAILGNPSSFRRRCARLSWSAIPQRFSSPLPHWLSAPQLPFLMECFALTGGAGRPTALSEG